MGEKQFEETVLRPLNCPACGLAVPAELSQCPNDGTQMVAPEDSPLHGRYEMLNLLGEGGMGVVYRARHPLMNKIVAVKLLKNQVSSSSDNIKRFQQEAKAASSLQHPNIMTVYDFGILPHGQAFLVMDYLEGKTLAELIKEKGSLTADVCLPIFEQICHALEHAHERGVLHRDLKPSNVMLCGSDGNQVKIVDFGLAKVSSEEFQAGLTQTGEVLGSPPYMSPEQCSGQSLDARSEIYSLGCLMYETLTGIQPFLGNNALETVFKQVHEQPAPFNAQLKASLPKRLEAVIMKTLEKDPAQRYRSMLELKTDLQAVRSGLSSQVRIGKRLRLPAIPVAYVVLLAALGLGILRHQMQPPAQPPTQSISAPAQITQAPPGPDLSKFKPAHPALEDDSTLLPKLAGEPAYETVDLTRTNVSDKFFQKIKLPHTRNLFLDGTVIHDDGLRAISSSDKSLKILSLRKVTGISSRGLAALAALPSLERLVIDHGWVDDDGVKEISKLKQLNSLDISRTAISDNGVAYLAGHAKIRTLRLTHTTIGDKALKSVATLSALQRLSVYDTRVTDAGIEDILSCPALDYLNIGKTAITDQGVARLAEKKTLVTLCPPSSMSKETMAKLKKALPRLVFKDYRE